MARSIDVSFAGLIARLAEDRPSVLYFIRTGGDTMHDILRQELVVGPGGVIEIHTPDLPAGSVAEVIVRLKKPVARKPTAKVAPSTTPEDLGWPPGFFEKTFGSLRDSPLVREPQGEYEVRDEIV
jgi:hypothetical protein